MVYKHYNRALTLRLLLVVLSAATAGFCFGSRQPLPFSVCLCCITGALLLNLIHFLNRTHQQIHYFIKAVKNNDTTLQFPVRSGNIIVDELHYSLNELNDIIKDIKIKHCISELYFSRILQNIDTGVMVFNENGFVVNINQTMLDLFGLKVLTHISQLDRVDTSLKHFFLALPGHERQPVDFHRNGEHIRLSVRSTVLSLKDEKIKLVTLQDIRNELERQELDSWIKLIRVLNHEIMNSLVPVISIAQSLKDIWEQPERSALAESEKNIHTVNGLDVIVERGKGLLHFVQHYRMFTKLPEIYPQPVSISAMFNRLSILVSPFKEQFGVAIRFHLPDEDFDIMIDEQMIAQVIINLVKNGAEAASGTNTGKVNIRCRKEHNATAAIFIHDNGTGIPSSISEEIFVPFFTTKQHGSGIGLSYSRQVMRAHGGTIAVQSTQGNTLFTVTL